MPNYNKSFNFRNGVQVDEDDLIVRSSLVGIGTTVPRSELDVRGDIKATGVVTSTNIFVTGIATFNQVAIGTGIQFFGNTGIISATFSGDGSQLSNLPTSQWIDVDVGAGFTSIYAAGNVGVATTNPSFAFQVSGSPDSAVELGVGINSVGDIKASGIITASSFVGSGAGLTSLNASNLLTGTIPTSVLPQDFSLSGLDLNELYVIGVSTLTNAGIHSLVTTNITASGVSTFNGNVSIAASALFGDNNKALFGAGNDLEIYHSGTNSYISNNVGSLYINDNGDSIHIQPQSGEESGVFNANGSVELYYDNSKKFETTGYGVTVTGITSTTNLTVSDTSDFVGQINADGNVKVAGLTDNQVLHATSTGTIEGNNNLTFDGSSLQVTGVTTTSDLYVTGVGTVATLAATSASSGVLTVDNVRIDGNTVDSTSGNLLLDSVGNVTVSTDLIVVGLATVNQGLYPDTDQGADLGDGSRRFGAAHIDDITIGVTDTNVIASVGGTSLILRAPGSSVSIENFSPVGVVTVTGNILPDGDKTIDLGSSSASYRELYVGELKLSNQALETQSGDLELTATTEIVRATQQFEVTGESRFNGDVYIGGTGLYVDVDNDRVGIGTTNGTQDFTLFSGGITTQEIVGTTAQIALGESLGVGNDSGTISFNNKELSIHNRDEGDINVVLNAGTGINTTGAFKVIHGGDSIISAGYSGVVGINKDDPTVALDVNGDLAVSGDGIVVGVLTIGQGAEQVTFGTTNAVINGTLVGNVVSVSGFSTFQNVIAQGNVSVGGSLAAVGVSSFLNATFGNNTNQFDGEIVTVHGNQQITGSLYLRDTSSAIAVASTDLASDTRPLLSEDNLPAINYGQLQVYGDMSVVRDGGGSVIFVASENDNSVKPAVATNSNVASRNPDYMMKVGIDTFVARCALDMGASGDYFLPPVHNATSKQYFIDNPGLQTIQDIGGSTGQIMPGALIFNEDRERLEVGIGTTGIFCGIVTTTYNKTGFDAITIPSMTSTNRNTTTNAGGIHAGSLIYNTTETRLEVYNGSSWTSLSGGSVGVLEVQDDQSVVGVAGTIDFGTGLAVSAVSAGVVTVTSSAGSGLQSRGSLSQSTGSIGAGTTTNITITGHKSYALQKVGISSAAWVVLYTDAASRTADESRAYTTDPQPGSGVIAEVRTTTAGVSTFIMSPGIIGWNDDATPGNNIYARVTNNESSDSDITVTLTAVQLES